MEYGGNIMGILCYGNMMGILWWEYGDGNMMMIHDSRHILIYHGNI